MDESSNPPSSPENPFDSPGAAGSYTPPRVASTSIPKTIGILNILFGVLLCFCGVAFAAQSLWWSAMGPAFEQGMQNAQAEMQSQIEQRKERIQELIEQEKAAENEDEREALRAERQRLEGLPEGLPDITAPMKMATDRRIIVHAIVAAGTGLVFNVLFVISGVGLVGFKEWARNLALWVSGLKIVRLVANTAYRIVVIAPLMARQMDQMMQGVNQQAGPGAAPMDAFGAMFSTMQSAGAVATLVFGSIYPIVVLVCLTRPRVKAACGGSVGSAGNM